MKDDKRVWVARLELYSGHYITNASYYCIANPDSQILKII